MQNKTIKINKHKKQAQHIVELALVMPFFIIFFCLIFQVMVETYSRYKFAYVFTNAAINSILKQKIYENSDDAKDYNIAKEIQNTAIRTLVNSNNTPFTNVEVSKIDTEDETFIVGAFQYMANRLFTNSHTGYFYFTIPINRAYSEPIVLNKKTEDLDLFFENYYTPYFDSVQQTAAGGE